MHSIVPVCIKHVHEKPQNNMMWLLASTDNILSNTSLFQYNLSFCTYLKLLELLLWCYSSQSCLHPTPLNTWLYRWYYGWTVVTRCCVNDRMIYYSETTLYILVRADVMECAGASIYMCLLPTTCATQWFRRGHGICSSILMHMKKCIHCINYTISNRIA